MNSPSNKAGNITSEELESVREMLEYFDLPTSVSKSEYDASSILSATKSDKKMENNKIKFVILNSIGDAAIDREIDDETLLEAIDYVLK